VSSGTFNLNSTVISRTIDKDVTYSLASSSHDVYMSDIITQF